MTIEDEKRLSALTEAREGLLKTHQECGGLLSILMRIDDDISGIMKGKVKVSP